MCSTRTSLSPGSSSARYVGLEVLFEAAFAPIAMRATIVHAPPLDVRVSDDPDDDMFLVAALVSSAPIVVSGDRDLLSVSGWRGIAVLTPRQFHDQYISGR